MGVFARFRARETMVLTEKRLWCRCGLARRPVVFRPSASEARHDSSIAPKVPIPRVSPLILLIGTLEQRTKCIWSAGKVLGVVSLACAAQRTTMHHGRPHAGPHCTQHQAARGWCSYCNASSSTPNPCIFRRETSNLTDGCIGDGADPPIFHHRSRALDLDVEVHCSNHTRVRVIHCYCMSSIAR